MELLFPATGVLYATSCALFLVHLAKGNSKATKAAKYILFTATVAHMGYFVLTYLKSGHTPLDSIYGTLSIASWVMVTTFLSATLKYRTDVLGAFVTPVTLLFFLGAGLGSGDEVVPQDVRQTLLPLHIGANILGIGAFALAFSAATAYVIQEKLLRAKKIGGLFQRLPSLDVLDGLGFRALVVGFPLLTIGLVTGAFWIVGGTGISLAQGMGIVSWLVFATVLLLRLSVGWTGRRAAFGTMLGFACTASVLVIYAVGSGGAQ